MNWPNNPTVPKSEFRRALNLHCHKELGVGLSDLPDIINFDDVWWEGQTAKEALQMIAGCIQDFKDDMGYEDDEELVDEDEEAQWESEQEDEREMEWMSGH